MVHVLTISEAICVRKMFRVNTLFVIVIPGFRSYQYQCFRLVHALYNFGGARVTALQRVLCRVK